MRMDAENFAKLTAILDLLDRYKKNLAQALQQEAPGRARSVLQAGRTLSKRSTRTEGLFGFGSGNEGRPCVCRLPYEWHFECATEVGEYLSLKKRSQLLRSYLRSLGGM